MDAHILIDHDNVPAQFTKAGLAGLAMRVVSLLDGSIKDLGDLHVRLYGGWYDASGGLTRVGTRIAQEIGRDFPITKLNQSRQIRRVACEIASALIDSPQDLLPFTFRKRPGIRSRLSRVRPPNCIDHSKCSIDAVVAWSRGVCPESGCPVTPENVFGFYEQKLVDTMLCCDVVALALRNPRAPIVILSDDDDLAPAVLMSAKLGAPIHLIEMRGNKQGTYRSLFASYNVRTASL
jgi:hypothetical protein